MHYRGSRPERLVISGPQGALHECKGVGAKELIDVQSARILLFVHRIQVPTNLHSDITVEDICSRGLTKVKQDKTYPTAWWPKAPHALTLWGTATASAREICRMAFMVGRRKWAEADVGNVND